MQSVCKVRSRPEGFQGHFFWLQLVFWLQTLSGPGVRGGTGQPRTPRRHRTALILVTRAIRLQLWLQLWLQDFPRTAMFFYRFICFISLVTNVTKKSSKSFWDRKPYAISLQGKV